jgi:hypothetical protein
LSGAFFVRPAAHDFSTEKATKHPFGDWQIGNRTACEERRYLL